jgi:chromosome segregation ATPase
LAKLAALESEIALLKRRLTRLEQTVAAKRKENKQLMEELQRARTGLDHETMGRIDYQNQAQALLEEIDFLRRSHNQEVQDLQAMASRDTTGENREFFRNELAAAIRDIRTEYDQLTSTQKTDIESWYKLKVQEVQSQSACVNKEHSYHREELKRLRTQIGDLRGKLGDLESKVCCTISNYRPWVLFFDLPEKAEN